MKLESLPTNTKWGSPNKQNRTARANILISRRDGMENEKGTGGPWQTYLQLAFGIRKATPCAVVYTI
jgi:hypothetical protein